MSSASKKQGTRVFKKGSPNGKITVYLGKRDFVDHVTHVDPIDGVVLVDPEYLKEENDNTENKDRKVFGHVCAAFRYGREDLDVLGLTFRKDLYLASAQIYPKIDEETTKRPLTRLQERLIKSWVPMLILSSSSCHLTVQLVLLYSQLLEIQENHVASTTK